MAYDIIDIQNLDINWYFSDLFNRVCIAASAGGVLPKPIVENEEGNEQFHKIILELPKKFKVARNENVSNQIEGLTNQNRNLYFQDFEALASRGIYAFDKLKLNKPDDGFYMLVAYPIYDTTVDSFPIEKKQLSLIPRTKRSVISRFRQTVYESSFTPIDLTKILNN